MKTSSCSSCRAIFDKEAALTAGFDRASGEGVIPIDADHQHPPELIPALLDAWLAGHDVVLARRRDRNSSVSERSLAQWLYSLHNWVSEQAIPDHAGDFRLMDLCVVDALKQLPERRRFMKGLYAWVGFKHTFVDFDVEPRAGGRSTFSRRARWSLALEGFTSFSTAPLRLASWLGLVVALFALAHGAWVIARTLFLAVDLPGYASLMSAVLLLGGIQLVCIRMLGEHVGRTYSEAKQRPVYIVRRAYGPAPAEDGPSLPAQGRRALPGLGARGRAQHADPPGCRRRDGRGPGVRATARQRRRLRHGQHVLVLRQQPMGIPQGTHCGPLPAIHAGLRGWPGDHAGLQRSGQHLALALPGGRASDPCAAAGADLPVAPCLDLARPAALTREERRTPASPSTRWRRPGAMALPLEPG